MFKKRILKLVPLFTYQLSCCTAGMLLFVFFSGCQTKEINSAKIYIQSNDWDKAVEQLELAVAENPGNAEAHYLLGAVYGVNARLKEMSKEFDISLKLSDKYKKAITAERERHWIKHFDDGLRSIKQQDFDKAESFFKTATIIIPDKHDAYKQLAFVYLKKNDLDKTYLIYSRLLEESPDDVELLSSIGNLYYSQKQFDKVLPVLEHILVLEPNNRDALANLALSYNALGRTDEATDAFEKAIKANPQDKDLIFLYGAHFYKQKQYAKAIQVFTQLLDKNPDDFEANSNIGNAYLSIAESLRLKLSPAANGLTIDEIKQIKSEAMLNYKQAIPYLKKAVEVNSGYPTLWRNLGAAYISTGEYEKGEQAYLKAEEVLVNASEVN